MSVSFLIYLANCIYYYKKWNRNNYKCFAIISNVKILKLLYFKNSNHQIELNNERLKSLTSMITALCGMLEQRLVFVLADMFADMLANLLGRVDGERGVGGEDCDVTVVVTRQRGVYNSTFCRFWTICTPNLWGSFKININNITICLTNIWNKHWRDV